jgi:hypothetical protein
VGREQLAEAAAAASRGVSGRRGEPREPDPDAHDGERGRSSPHPRGRSARAIWCIPGVQGITASDAQRPRRRLSRTCYCRRTDKGMALSSSAFHVFPPETSRAASCFPRA